MQWPVFGVTIPPAVMPILSRHVDVGSVTCTPVVQELTRRDIKVIVALPHQGIEPRVFGLELRLTLYQ